MAIYKRVKVGKDEQGNAIYESVKMSSSEVKAKIKKINKWTEEEYNKQYDIFKNKLRAYEAYEAQHGRVRKQSPVEILYREANAKKREGKNYKPSIAMQRLRSFTSVSSGKAGKTALQGKRYQERRTKLYEEATLKQFGGFIEKNPQAQEIMEKIKDPVKRELALTDLANKVKAQIDKEGKVQEKQAIPFGETFGSTDAVDDFNVDDYL